MRESDMAQDTGLPDIQLDSAGLYREDIFTDRKAGTIRRLVRSRSMARRIPTEPCCTRDRRSC